MVIFEFETDNSIRKATQVTTLVSLEENGSFKVSEGDDCVSHLHSLSDQTLVCHGAIGGLKLTLLQHLYPWFNPVALFDPMAQLQHESNASLLGLDGWAQDLGIKIPGLKDYSGANIDRLKARCSVVKAMVAKAPQGPMYPYFAQGRTALLRYAKRALLTGERPIYDLKLHLKLDRLTDRIMSNYLSPFDGGAYAKALGKPEAKALSAMKDAMEKAAKRGYLKGLDGKKLYVQKGKPLAPVLMAEAEEALLIYIAGALDFELRCRPELAFDLCQTGGGGLCILVDEDFPKEVLRVATNAAIQRVRERLKFNPELPFTWEISLSEYIE